MGRAYAAALRANGPLFNAIEQALRSLTYVLPGRFPHSELASEGVYSFVSIMALYHDAILQDTGLPISTTMKGLASDGSPSLFNRYTRHMLRQPSTKPWYARLAYALAVLEHVQLLAEMVAEEFAKSRATAAGKSARGAADALRWRVVTLMETGKFICRLFIFQMSKNRTLLRSQVLERDYDMARLTAQPSLTSTSAQATSSLTPTSSPALSWEGRRTHRIHPSILAIAASPSPSTNDPSKPNAPEDAESQRQPSRLAGDDATRYLLSRALTDCARSPADLVLPLRGLRAVAEWAYIARPLIYLMALKRWGGFSGGKEGKRSWKPWALSLGIEVFSLVVLAAGFGGKGQSADLTTLEREEINRRIPLLGYYLLRQPVYDSFTRGKLEKLVQSLASKPILSLFSGYLSDYVSMWGEYHYATNL